MQININDVLLLDTFDSNNEEHKWLLEQFNNASHSKFISKISDRLMLNGSQKFFPFDTAFVVSLFSGEIIGYVFISSIRNDEVYLESSILKEKRGKKYGSLILSSVTDYLFENYNIKEIALDIDASNEASIRTAVSCGYYEDSFDNMKFIFKNYNSNYVNKRRGGK